MASDVYFSDLRTDFGNNLLDKLNRVMREAGIDTMIPSISSLVESCIGDILRSKTMCMKEGI